MQTPSSSTGRRERNRLDKLERITAAARELFAARGVDEVTTQQVADLADVGSGTVFLYARSKSELLLLSQNAEYADALERGRIDEARALDPIDAIVAILRPVVECNRKHPANGRAYLRELVFGDASEPFHRAARELSEATGDLVVESLIRRTALERPTAEATGRIVAGIQLHAMATAGPDAAAADVVEEIRGQLAILLG
ncbi:TetR/AcrR family transcriptional regulator [Agromyces seonyuensis]|uniref:TetR family transcriptional regulator n=1 Tax=Agromyces seonyuensis TaxID=2662446 RepID=A0A6I4NYY1_9MICO|nr:TetR/AcrR family transcriptional regulator [Agromyces seonyuensis]MWB98412.1 TetR family transcriptional regulator [Agromyces seonyuensis]